MTSTFHTLFFVSLGVLGLGACTAVPVPTASVEHAPFKAQINQEGYASIPNAPPAPFEPSAPNESTQPTAEQVAAQEQVARVAQFQGKVSDEAMALAERLRREEKGNFVSLYFDNEGDPSVVFQFLRDGSQTLRKYSRNPRFFGKTVRWSEAELKAAADFMWKTFGEDRVLQATGIGRNEVNAEISVSEADFRALVARKGVTIPEPVVLHFRAAPVVPLINPPRPATKDGAVPLGVASLIRIFPRDDRPAGVLHSIDSRVKVVLKDGCFRASDRSDALVLFPFGANLFVDSEGYLAFGSGESPGYARVGETVIFGGSVYEVETPTLVGPIHEVCGPGKVIKVEGLKSAAARDAQQAVADDANALRSLRERYGLGELQAQRALAWLKRRQETPPRQDTPEGGVLPPIPASLIVNAPPSPVMDQRKCPGGTTLSFGLCRTADGYIRPYPEWLAAFLEEDR